jgi:hypothetical protein
MCGTGTGDGRVPDLAGAHFALSAEDKSRAYRYSRGSKTHHAPAQAYRPAVLSRLGFFTVVLLGAIYRGERRLGRPCVSPARPSDGS